MIPRLRFTAFLTLLALTRSYGQQPVFRHYSVDDGLPSSEVYYAYQDKMGYMWFATDRGVSRYDGYSFKTYSSENGLRDNTIFRFFTDWNERMWLHPFSETLTYIRNDSVYSVDRNISRGGVQSSLRSFFLAKGDTLWFSIDLERDIFYSTPKDRRPVLWRNGKETKGSCFYFINPVSGMFRQKDSLIINHSLFFRDDLPVKIYYDKQARSSLTFRNNDIHCVRLTDDKFLFYFGNVLVCFSEKGLIFEKKFDKRIIYAGQDNKGTIWIGLFKGGAMGFSSIDILKEIDPLSSKTALTRNHFLKNQSVSCVFRDTENGLWFTTLETGVYYTSSVSFLSYTTREGLTENNVVCLSTGRKGEMFVGLQDGNLFLINSKGLSPVSLPEKDKLPFFRPGKNLIKRLDGKIWFCSGGGIYEIDQETDKIKLILPEYPLTAYFQENENQTWLGDAGGLQKLEGSELTYSSYQRLPTLRISAISKYQDELWIGSLKGLYTFDGTFRFRGYEHPLLQTRVTDLKTVGNRLWIATRGTGVLVKEGKTVTRISTPEGLVVNLCNSLYVDGDSIIWVCTNRGISKIRLTGDSLLRYTIKNYTTQNGMISNEINSVSRDGDFLWVATNKGLSVFNTREANINTRRPPVYMAGVKVNNTNYSRFKTHVLRHDSNNVHFRFTGLSYRSAGNIMYRYRLEGLDTAWKYTSLSEVQYSNLPSGQYRFSVYALNSDGYASAAPASFSFMISKAWWNTWWFRVLVAFGAVSAMASIYITRVRHETRKAREKVALNKQIGQLELRALRAQMNPHFIFNSLNSIQKFIALNEPESAHRFLSKFGSLIRSIMANSSRSFLSVKEELDSIGLYLELECLRLENKFRYSITVDPDIDIYNTLIPAMIIQPYVENAIWHGIMPSSKEGVIDISFKLSGSFILCTVRDNGIGRRRSAELKTLRPNHESAGMKITEERLNILTLTEDLISSIKVRDLEEGDEQGTVIELAFPVKYEF